MGSRDRHAKEGRKDPRDSNVTGEIKQGYGSLQKG